VSRFTAPTRQEVRQEPNLLLNHPKLKNRMTLFEVLRKSKLCRGDLFPLVLGGWTPRGGLGRKLTIGALLIRVTNSSMGATYRCLQNDCSLHQSFLLHTVVSKTSYPLHARNTYISGVAVPKLVVQQTPSGYQHPRSVDRVSWRPTDVKKVGTHAPHTRRSLITPATGPKTLKMVSPVGPLRGLCI